MKKLLTVLLPLALLLTACTAAPPPAEPELPSEPPAQEATLPSDEAPLPSDAVEQEPFLFSRENFPRLDGSTSTAPLARSVCAALLGEDVQAVADLVQFSRTTQSYRNLMAGEADLLLAAEPAPEVMAELDAGGKWTLTPFATDALVFVVNADNPVDSLTIEQVQKIYTGEITNWKEVGGADMAIVPFQRNAEAGSQTMFEKLVMAGQPLMEPPTYWVSDSMSGLLEAVRSYDNSPAAIGYTVYYYANDMEMAKGLKVLAIDDVKPSADAIRAGDYPFLNPYFVAIAKDAPEDSAARALYDWVLGEEGQALAAAEGYVPVLDVTSDTLALPADVDGGRWHSYTVNDLIPGDYGPLYPYAGSSSPGSVTYEWTDGNGQSQSFTETFSTMLYGLMTKDGKLVTDPCYTGVILPIAHIDGEAVPYPVLLLARSEPEWELDGLSSQRYAVCARDGSWVTEHEFWGYSGKDGELLLLGVNGVTRLDCESGARRDWSWAALGIDEAEVPDLVEFVIYGSGLTWTDAGIGLGPVDINDIESENDLYRILDPETGNIFTLSRQEWYDLEDAYRQSIWYSNENWTYTRDLEHIYLELDGITYTLPLPEDLLQVNHVDVRDDYVIVSDYSGNESGSWLFRLSTGELLTASGFISFLYDTADYAAPAYIRVEDYMNLNCTLYTPEFEPFLSYEGISVYFSHQDGLLTARQDESFFAAYDAGTQECVFYRNFEF